MHITHSLMNFLRNSLIQVIDNVYFTEIPILPFSQLTQIACLYYFLHYIKQKDGRNPGSRSRL